MQTSLFAPSPTPAQHLQLPDADIQFEPAFLSPSEADALFAHLHATIPWRQDSISLYGKTHPLPRLQQWYGPPEGGYTWSGIRMQPLPLLPELAALLARLERHTQARYNSLLANLYRDGNDCVHWHADDEPELGEEPVIASISLGQARSFRLKHKTRKDIEPVSLELPSGSLVVMAGRTQACWLHTIPPRPRLSGARINLTFRWVARREGAAR